MDETEFLWDHFKFNAEQRLKGFNFFVLLSIFADGGVLTAINKGFDERLLVVLGLFVIVLSVVFWLVDSRSQQLLELAIPGMKEIEKNFDEKCRLFALDAENQGVFVRYTFAFRVLMLCQLLFGVGVSGFGAVQWFC